MGKNSNQKKAQQLGMTYGTAQNRLRKSLLFSLVKQLGLDMCYQCGHVIEDKADLSIEHIEPWLDSDDPVENFFALDNIAFSHLSCNSGAARYNPEAQTMAGERNGSSKLTWDDIEAIRSIYAYQDVSQRELARRYGVNQKTISDIIIYETWKI